MLIKICGISRHEDIDYVNEARPDFIGFVFANSPGQVSTVMAQYLRFRLAEGIQPAGVFVNAPVKLIAELYRNGTISAAQLNGDEDDSYIIRLKEVTYNETRKPITVIKAIKVKETSSLTSPEKFINADFLLLDSSASGKRGGKPFNWDILKKHRINKPWFFSGDINLKNIEKAIELKPAGINVSEGVETKGAKDRKKILELTSIVTSRQPRKPESLHIISTTHSESYSRKLTVNG